MKTILFFILTSCSLSAQVETKPVSTTDPASGQNVPTYPVMSQSERETLRLYPSAPWPAKYNWKQGAKKTIVPGVMSFSAGAFGGLNEGLLWRKDQFFSKFPRANRQYWDYEISWQNKYWRNVPVQLSDGYHFTEFAHNTLLFTTGIWSGADMRKRWYNENWKFRTMDILLRTAVCSVSYWAGSQIVYNGILHK